MLSLPFTALVPKVAHLKGLYQPRSSGLALSGIRTHTQKLSIISQATKPLYMSMWAKPCPPSVSEPFSSLIAENCILQQSILHGKDTQGQANRTSDTRQEFSKEITASLSLHRVSQPRPLPTP